MTLSTLTAGTRGVELGHVNTNDKNSTLVIAVCSVRIELETLKRLYNLVHAFTDTAGVDQFTPLH